MLKKIAVAAMFLASATSPAFAHLDPAGHGSFLSGFSHPLFGLDHILVMVAVGLWAASLGGRALWLVPAVFVATMALGFLAALAGLPLPFVEPVILASVVATGLMIALALPLGTSGVVAMVAFFAVFHGHAHGGELGGAGALPFAAGFAVATAFLHAAGIGIGLLSRASTHATRLAGWLTALAGAWLALAA